MSHQPLIEQYFEACTAGTAADIESCFTPDAVVFDTNHKPVRSAGGIADFWVQIRAQWAGAVWRVDSCVSEGDSAAIEWTMTGTHDGKNFSIRGSEHYRVTQGRIAEIRQYWTFNRNNPNTGLVDFPYE